MEYSELYREFRDESLKTWTRIMQPTVESEGFVKAMDSSATALLEGQKQAREAQIKALEAMNVPTRKDLAHLSHQVQLAEKRALECEDRAEALTTRTRVLEQRLEDVLAAIEATRERIAHLQDAVAAPAAIQVPADAVKDAAPAALKPAKAKGAAKPKATAQVEESTKKKPAPRKKK